MNSIYFEAMEWLKKRKSEEAFFRAQGKVDTQIMDFFLEALNRPELSAQWRIIIGGSAGKGTVCRYIEKMLNSVGKSTLLLSSPHLQSLHERIRINGKLVNKTDLGESILRIKKIALDKKVLPTFYEIMVLAGLLIGCKKNIDIIIGEIGCGGALDAVNRISGKRIAGITFIGSDHKKLFGNDLRKTAETKAGIFTHESVYNVSYEQKYCSIFDKISNLEIKYIKGKKHELNKKLAQNICEQIICSKIEKIPKIQIPCRFEILKWKNNQTYIIDGAHSKERFEYLIPQLNSKLNPKILILSFRRRYDLNALKVLKPFFDTVFLPLMTKDLNSFYSPEELQKIFPQGIIFKTLDEAFRKSKSLKKTVLVSGSMALCGVFRNYFYPLKAIEDQQTEFPDV